MKKITDPLVELVQNAINVGVKVTFNKNGTDFIYNDGEKNYFLRKEDSNSAARS